MYNSENIASVSSSTFRIAAAGIKSNSDGEILITTEGDDLCLWSLSDDRCPVAYARVEAKIKKEVHGRFLLKSLKEKANKSERLYFN